MITNPEIGAELKPVSWNQDRITDSSHLVVFSIMKNLPAEYIDRFTDRTAEVRGVTTEPLASYRNLMVGNLVYGQRSLTINEWATRHSINHDSQ